MVRGEGLARVEVWVGLYMSQGNVFVISSHDGMTATKSGNSQLSTPREDQRVECNFSTFLQHFPSTSPPFITPQPALSFSS